MADDHDLHAELVKITQALESLMGLGGLAGEEMRQPLLARKAELEAQLSDSGRLRRGEAAPRLGHQLWGLGAIAAILVWTPATSIHPNPQPQRKNHTLIKEP